MLENDYSPQSNDLKKIAKRKLNTNIEDFECYDNQSTVMYTHSRLDLVSYQKYQCVQAVAASEEYFSLENFPFFAKKFDSTLTSYVKYEANVGRRLAGGWRVYGDYVHDILEHKHP